MSSFSWLVYLRCARVCSSTRPEELKRPGAQQICKPSSHYPRSVEKKYRVVSKLRYSVDQTKEFANILEPVVSKLQTISRFFYIYKFCWATQDVRRRIRWRPGGWFPSARRGWSRGEEVLLQLQTRTWWRGKMGTIPALVTTGEEDALRGFRHEALQPPASGTDSNKMSEVKLSTPRSYRLAGWPSQSMSLPWRTLGTRRRGWKLKNVMRLSWQG